MYVCNMLFRFCYWYSFSCRLMHYLNLYQMGLFKNICKCRYKFPSVDAMSNVARDLISRMLTISPNDRLGSFVNAEKDIQVHKFFDGINWKNFKANKPPHKPKFSDPLDGSNFDDFSRLEAREKKEKKYKLTAKEQRMFDKF